ncbi:MAG: transglutaminase-like protein [Acidobacteriaceae bacterium]|nr:transglutaminase-like protein [Acidobacteriaceae bacterium]
MALHTTAPHGKDITLAAAIRRYFDVVLYLLIFTGFGTLASTGRLDLATVLVVTSALLYRGYILAHRRQVILSERWTNLLTIACVGFFIADDFLISRAFLGATVHLVLFVMLVRLFSAQRDRDHYFLAVLSFLMVLAAAVLTVDSTFLFALAGFILLAVAAFILMEMMHSLKKSAVLARDPRVQSAHRKLSFAIVAIAPVLLLLILIGASGIFFLLPRVSARFMSAETGANDITMGFSARVELGRIGQIQQSKTVVMHVAIDGDSFGAFAPKLRGVALNRFDGRTWSNTSGKRTVFRGSDGRFDLALRNSQVAPARGRSIHYRVTMEPFVTEVFFLLAEPQSLEGTYRAVSEDSDGDVFDLDNEHPVTRYEANSEIRTPSRKSIQLTGDSYPAQIQQDYLQLPTLDPRIKPLTEKVVSAATTPYTRATAIENYLRTHYGYTLQLASSTPADPVADFLFVRRHGHCEYFSSAMAVMLRVVGIPARVVNGFAGGEFNDINSQYVIRASDAHSWVEAYIPGEGWLAFDPTPGGGNGQPHSQWDRLMLYVDAMSSFWREWVVNYDLAHQLRLTQDATHGSRAIVGQAQSWGRIHYDRMLAWARYAEARLGASTVKWGVRTVVAVALCLLIISIPRLLLLFQKIRVARRPRQAPRLAASIWYERMLRQTAKRGWTKSPAQTPEEFASLITDNTIKCHVSDFTEHYERARFGNSAEDVSRLPELYEEIKTAR